MSVRALALLAVLLLHRPAVLGGGSTLNRPHDPVVLTGADVPSLTGIAPGLLVAFRYDAGWVQIPVQVDERAVVDYGKIYNAGLMGFRNLVYCDAGTFTGADPDALLDDDDEIVFMARDAGGVPPSFSGPAGVVAGSGVQVAIGDPLDSGAAGSVFLFRTDGSLSPGAGASYVTYSFGLQSGSYLATYNTQSGPNPETSVAGSAFYEHRFSERWVDDVLKVKVGAATGVDILDRHKNLFAPDDCQRSEDTFSAGEGAFIVNKSGPVRALRSYIGANSGPLTQRDHRFYDRRHDLTTTLRVHSIPSGIMDFFDYSPAAAGMAYANNLNLAGVTIDGSPDTVNAGPIEWEMVTGAQGSLAIALSYATNIAGFAWTSYYRDDTATDPGHVQCTGDAFSYGASGTWVNQSIPNTDPLIPGGFSLMSASRSLYYEAPGMNVATAQLRNSQAKTPLTTVRSPWMGPAQPLIYVSDVSLNEGTGGVSTAFVFNVTLSAASVSPVTVFVQTVPGTALAGSDFTSLPSSAVVFPPNNTLQTVTVQVTHDNVGETNETFTLVLSNPAGAALGDGAGVGTILNDDLPSVSVADLSLPEGNGGNTTFLFIVSLSSPSAGIVSVGYSTQNGTATAGSDYTAATGTVNIFPGMTAFPISITAAGDATPEPTETFLVNLLGGTGYSTIADNQAVGTIVNDDNTITVTDVTLAEGSGGGTTSFDFTVSLSPAGTGTITVGYATADGSASAPGDYAAHPSSTLTFTPGQTTKTVSVLVARDSAGEPAEDFFVNLFGATDALITKAKGVGVITNDDNFAPVAGGDAYSTAEDTPLAVAAPGVLANDSDPEASPLTAILASGPASGALTLNADGSFSYTPASNFAGTATFTYQANDGTSSSAPATVTITVTAVNDAPTAVNDAYPVTEDTPISIAAPGVLGNDSDPEGSTLSASLVSTTSNGTLALSPSGAFTYTPGANFAGTDSFTYQAGDGAASSAVATVTLTVSAVNDAPVAAADAYSTPMNVTLNVAAPGVLANDTDAENSALTAALGTPPASGTLTLNTDGSFSYVPPAGFTGTRTFTYTASDGALSSSPATVTITVTGGANTPPVAVNDSASTAEDTTLVVAAPGVLANDTDADGNPLTAAVVSGPSSGSLTLNADGSYSFTPAANFSGTVTFTYQASDGAANSNVATVTLTVTPVNDAPAAANDAYSTPEDAALTVPAAGVLSNDSDPEGDAMNAVLVSVPSNGGVVLNSNGSFTYTPSPNFSGTDSFTYQASDGTPSAAATVTITVTPANDAPAGVADAYSVAPGGSLSSAAPGVLANDTDPDGDALTAAVATLPAFGTLTLNADGSFTYVPAAGYAGSDSFTYTAGDGTLSSAPVTVTITVAAAPPPPADDDDKDCGDCGGTGAEALLLLALLRAYFRWRRSAAPAAE